VRIEHVPEYRFNVFGNYTFDGGLLRGGSLGRGARYSSETVVSRAVDWNPVTGGYQAGDNGVLDLNASYPWKVLGYRINISFGVHNLWTKSIPRVPLFFRRAATGSSRLRSNSNRHIDFRNGFFRVTGLGPVTFFLFTRWRCVTLPLQAGSFRLRWPVASNVIGDESPLVSLHDPTH